MRSLGVSFLLCLQWARTVLIVERGIPPKERLRQQDLYSERMATGAKALVMKQTMTVRSGINESRYGPYEFAIAGGEAGGDQGYHRDEGHSQVRINFNHHK